MNAMRKLLVALVTLALRILFSPVLLMLAIRKYVSNADDLWTRREEMKRRKPTEDREFVRDVGIGDEHADAVLAIRARIAAFCCLPSASLRIDDPIGLLENFCNVLEHPPMTWSEILAEIEFPRREEYQAFAANREIVRWGTHADGSRSISLGETIRKLLSGESNAATNLF